MTNQRKQHLAKVQQAASDAKKAVDALAVTQGAGYGDTLDAAFDAAINLYANLRAHEMLFGNGGLEPRGLLNVDDGAAFSTKSDYMPRT
jgi:hypothetical protein